MFAFRPQFEWDAVEPKPPSRAPTRVRRARGARTRLDHPAPRSPRRAREERGRRIASRRGNLIVQCRDGAFDFGRHSSDDGRRVLSFRARENKRTRGNARARSPGRAACATVAATAERSSTVNGEVNRRLGRRWRKEAATYDARGERRDDRDARTSRRFRRRRTPSAEVGMRSVRAGGRVVELRRAPRRAWDERRLRLNASRMNGIDK